MGLRDSQGHSVDTFKSLSLLEQNWGRMKMTSLLKRSSCVLWDPPSSCRRWDHWEWDGKDSTGSERVKSGDDRAGRGKACLFTASKVCILETFFRIERNIVNIKKVKTAGQTFEFHSRFKFHDMLWEAPWDLGSSWLLILLGWPLSYLWLSTEISGCMPR